MSIEYASRERRQQIAGLVLRETLVRDVTFSSSLGTMPIEKRCEVLQVRCILMLAATAMKTSLAEEKDGNEDSPAVAISKKQIEVVRGVLNVRHLTLGIQGPLQAQTRELFP